jgi:hypothetical protein
MALPIKRPQVLGDKTTHRVEFLTHRWESSGTCPMEMTKALRRLRCFYMWTLILDHPPSGATAQQFRCVAEWELPGDSSLGLMGGVVFDRDETGERFQSGILAVTFSKPLADNVRGFVELAGRSLAEQRFGGNVITFDTGVTYAVGKDMQWDVSAAFGLNKETPDYAVGIGFSIRFR